MGLQSMDDLLLLGVECLALRFLLYFSKKQLLQYIVSCNVWYLIGILSCVLVRVFLLFLCCRFPFRNRTKLTCNYGIDPLNLLDTLYLSLFLS